ncbi:prepilin-type N-terminal cleavage/methylation domain-containing protein [bacterium]|nr:prepilin-type N-terminal cleavage/methylation domain-containing protein [bacterium]
MTRAPRLYSLRDVWPRTGFVLLEVLVSLAIMGIAISMVLRSFTLSLKAVDHSENVAVGAMLAQGLVDRWELEPPQPGDLSGDFGDDYSGFTYDAIYEPEILTYEGVSRAEEVRRLSRLRRLSLDVFYANQRAQREGKRLRVLRVETALSSSERFTAPARIRNEISFGDDLEPQR